MTKWMHKEPLEKQIDQVACRVCVQGCKCVFLCWCIHDLCILLCSYLRALATEEYAMWTSSSMGQVEENSSLAYAAFRYLQRFVRDSGMLKLRYFRHTTCREDKMLQFLTKNIRI